MGRSYCIIFLSILFISCSDNKAEKPSVPAPAPPIYYFYPKANVYYDTVNKDYIFLASDGSTWTSGKQIPAAMQGMMDKSVLLDTFSQPVWRDNQNHKFVYAAVLYATPEDTVEREKPKPAVQPPVNTDSSGEKKEKKGLRKFFDKIFGKKKDKEKDSN